MTGEPQPSLSATDLLIDCRDTIRAALVAQMEPWQAWHPRPPAARIGRIRIMSHKKCTTCGATNPGDNMFCSNVFHYTKNEAPPEGWVVVTELPYSEYRVIRTETGWDIYIKDDPSYT